MFQHRPTMPVMALAGAFRVPTAAITFASGPRLAKRRDNEQSLPPL